MKKNKRNSNEKKYGYEHMQFFWSLNTSSNNSHGNENKDRDNKLKNKSQ